MEAHSFVIAATVPAISMYEKITCVTGIILAVCGIFAVVSVFVAYKQYKSQLKEKKRDNEYEKKKCACDMAHYFADEIIPLISAIERAIKLSDENSYKKMLSVFPSDTIKDFDEVEMKGFLIASQIEQPFIERTLFKVNSKVLFQVKLKVSGNIVDRSAIYDFYSAVLADYDPECNVKADLLRSDYITSQEKLLNKLEWFSMTFHNGIADEETVYQSLHQAFLSGVNLMYYRIAKANTYNPDKYYTNIIWLYNCWNDRLKADQKEQLRRDRDARAPIHEVKPVE